jgi:hypothetical protein
MEPLLASLLDLLNELEGSNIPIMVGGGFGLYLKRLHLTSSGKQTLFSELPEPRATNDLDLFLRVEVLVDLERTRLVAQAIQRLGYRAVEHAKFLQWEREVTRGQPGQVVKIDVLVGPLGDHRTNFRITRPRVRPKGDVEFHAHETEEAIHIEDDPITIAVSGQRSDGSSCEGAVEIPQAFPYLMMKLHAFDDRKDQPNKDFGRHHAMDLYTIIGMMTEEEYERAKGWSAASRDNSHVQRAGEIVRNQFASTVSPGTLKLREHQLYRENFRLDDFLAVLGEIFPS